jgi:hypothetical protein
MIYSILIRTGQINTQLIAFTFIISLIGSMPIGAAAQS